jgi:flagellar biosynthesis protein FliQ
MNTAVAVELFRQALLTTFWLSLPILAIGFIAGIVISLIQIITSMQDASFGAVPRLAAFLFRAVAGDAVDAEQADELYDWHCSAT